jgi:hypothetical protein
VEALAQALSTISTSINKNTSRYSRYSIKPGQERSRSLRFMNSLINSRKPPKWETEPLQDRVKCQVDNLHNKKPLENQHLQG